LPITKFSRKAVRERLICLPQDPLLFPGSFRFNLDPEARVSSEDDFFDALDAVGLKDVVDSKGGLHADIGQLSHGQQQLLGLARAIIRKGICKGKCMLVLDEATSNLDSVTEETVRKVIDAEFKENTVISVAHRLDTVRDADQVIMLEQGAIAKIGRPEELF
jgi:ATP-binding cassette subfamily C (CFTR/MRP) protein 1